MTRLQSEWHRLYLPHPSSGAEAAAEKPSLVDPDGQVRAMILSLGGPADWTALSIIWKAVQSDLELPAPAIAVSGVDSYQLWFSLAKAVPASEAHAFLESLRTRYLAHIAPSRFGLLPGVDAEAAREALHAELVPGREVLTGQWSAFLAPDLAPMFEETPWLDIPPSPQGQAELLASLQSIRPTAWQTALERLQAASAPTKPSSTLDSGEPAGNHSDPKRFLTGVMNDETVALALRIEAAKALLPYGCPRD
jgi:hypothetical protein